MVADVETLEPNEGYDLMTCCGVFDFVVNPELAIRRPRGSRRARRATRHSGAAGRPGWVVLSHGEESPRHRGEPVLSPLVRGACEETQAENHRSPGPSAVQSRPRVRARSGRRVSPRRAPGEILVSKLGHVNWGGHHSMPRQLRKCRGRSSSAGRSRRSGSCIQSPRSWRYRPH